MNCPNCGNYILRQANFCNCCGYSLKPIQPMQPYIPQKANQNRSKNRKDYIVVVIVVLLVLLEIFAWINPGDIFSDITENDANNPYSSNGLESSNLDDLESYQPNEYVQQVVPPNLREFYTEIEGDRTDVITMMVYIIGSDLESEAGFATEDINEMLRANFGDNVNLVLMTGGSNYWYNDEISNSVCQYWQVKNGDLLSLNDNLGRLNMTLPETLSNFINYSAEAFPANRYNLIMWNHGGGTFSGFGNDEFFPESTFTLSTLDEAFMQSEVRFDIVGFDACLMGTSETALMLEPYADYLIASQETVGGIGLEYTSMLTALGSNSSISTIDLGKIIIDNYISESEGQYRNPEATLSLIDLRYMPYTYELLTTFLLNSATEIRNNEYYEISSARSNAKDFGEGDYEQIDIIDYINKIDVEGGQEVIDAVTSAVKYYKNSDDIGQAHGLAMYFPYDYLNSYSKMQDVLHEIGVSEDYTEFFDVFVSAMHGGQSPENSIIGEITSEDWYDPETAWIYEQENDGEVLEELIINLKDDGYVLSLSDEQWNTINTIELQVLLDDGEGYLDLGRDNVYEFDNDGDLKVEFDYSWVALDGHVVPYYVEGEDYESDNWHTYGIVPAYLNGDEYIEIIVRWDYKYPEGYVEGYRKYTETGVPAGKGYFDLKPGDTINWIVDYYTYDFQYEDYYLFNESYTVPNREIIVSYEDVGDMDALIFFRLTDYFNNVYETEAVIYTD